MKKSPNCGKNDGAARPGLEPGQAVVRAGGWAGARWSQTGVHLDPAGRRPAQVLQQERKWARAGFSDDHVGGW